MTRWFDLGKEALSRVLPDVPEGYACPICWRVFSEADMEAGALSLEHAPAARLGGKEVVLTCVGCNSSAGHKLDAHAIARSRMLDFASGTLEGWLPVTLQAGGLELNGEGSSIDRSIFVKGDPKRNPPGTAEAWTAYMDEWIQGGAAEPEQHMLFRLAWNERAAHLAALRAAYLLAFAALGYTYIMSPILRPVRKQLQDLDTEHIRVFSLTVPRAASETRRMLIVNEPSPLRSLTIQFGRSVVLLPWVDNDLYAGLARESDARGGSTATVDFEGSEFPWPAHPTFALDFARQ